MFLHLVYVPRIWHWLAGRRIATVRDLSSFHGYVITSGLNGVAPMCIAERLWRQVSLQWRDHFIAAHDCLINMLSCRNFCDRGCLSRLDELPSTVRGGCMLCLIVW